MERDTTECSRSDLWCGICGCCTVLSIILSFFALFLWFIISSVTEDQVLQPHFRIADATTVNLRLFNNSGDSSDGAAVNYLLSGQWNMTLILNNPNPKFPIRYTALHVRLWYKSRDHDVASTHLTPVNQLHMGETRVTVKFTADQQYVDADVATNITAHALFGVTLFIKYEIQRIKPGVFDDETDDEFQVDDCYPLLPNPITTANSSSVSFNSTSTACVSIFGDLSNHCGDYYFSYFSD